MAGVLAIAAVVSTLLALHFHGQVRDERGRRSVPSVSPSATPSASLVGPAAGSAPPLAMTSYELDTGTAQTTVYLAAAASQGGSATTGQLLVTALIRGGTAGTHYRLVGGNCDPTSPADVVWAEGTADATGTAYLTGGVRTLPKSDQYFMTIDPWRPASGGNARFIPGLEGVFVLGEADSFVGHVNRVAGVGAGECFIGP